MHFPSTGALALAFSTVHAFRDASPFFMLSTAEGFDLQAAGHSEDSRLRTASSLTSDVSNILSECPTDLYIIVSQPSVEPADFASSKTTPFLSAKIKNGKEQGIRSSLIIDEVVGDVDVECWHTVLKSQCGALIVEVDAVKGIPIEQKKMPVVYNVWLPAPNTPEDLTENDAFLASVMDIVPSQTFTLLYVTSPGAMSRRVHNAESGFYEMESQAQEAMHIDLRRDLSDSWRKRASNETLVDGPLFDRYQFLTPGLFMGFLVAFILLSIAYVGFPHFRVCKSHMRLLTRRVVHLPQRKLNETRADPCEHG